MAYNTVHGIVLREVNYKDYDKLLTVLTKECGLLTLKARGVRRNSSDLKSASQLLAYSEFTYLDIRGYNTITEASVTEMFSGLRTRIEAVTLGFYFAQIAELISQEDSQDPRILALLLNSLYAASCELYPLCKIKAAYEWKAASLAGFSPYLSGCSVCSRQDAQYFNITNGGLQCSDCAKLYPDGLRIPVNRSVVQAMKYVIHANEKQFLSFSLDEDSMQSFGNASEAFLLMQFEQTFSSLNMYKTLIYIDPKGIQNDKAN